MSASSLAAGAVLRASARRSLAARWLLPAPAASTALRRASGELRVGVGCPFGAAPLRGPFALRCVAARRFLTAFFRYEVGEAGPGCARPCARTRRRLCGRAAAAPPSAARQPLSSAGLGRLDGGRWLRFRHRGRLVSGIRVAGRLAGGVLFPVRSGGGAWLASGPGRMSRAPGAWAPREAGAGTGGVARVWAHLWPVGRSPWRSQCGSFWLFSSPASSWLRRELCGRNGGMRFWQAGPANEIPANYVPWLEKAAMKYKLGPKGFSIVAAIHSVESDFGRSTLPGVARGTQNSAGAEGPGQFLVSSWETYGRMPTATGKGRLRHSRLDLRHRQLHALSPGRRRTGTGRSSPTTMPSGTSKRCWKKRKSFGAQMHEVCESASRSLGVVASANIGSGRRRRQVDRIEADPLLLGRWPRTKARPLDGYGRILPLGNEGARLLGVGALAAGAQRLSRSRWLAL